MKLLKNRKFLVMAIFVLLTMPFMVLAEEPVNSPSPSPLLPEESGEGENQETGGEVETPTPSPSPTPTPTPTPVPSDGYLNSLEVLGVNSIKKEFDKTKQEYIATVTSKTESVEISAIPEISADKVSCNKPAKLEEDNGTYKFKVELSEGENVFEIGVKTESGKTTIYTLRITRATSKLNVKSFELVGTTLNEVFKPDTYQYTVDVPYTVETVSVKDGSIKLESEDAKVTVTGGEKLKVGSNNILKITVKNEAGETREYKITITRGTEDELMGDDDNNGVISSEVITSEEEIVPQPEQNKDTDNNNSGGNNLTYVLVVVVCLLLLTIGIIGIYFFVKTKEKSEKSKQKRIAKLKKKQAKIEEELTGLMPVITPEIEEAHFNKKQEEVVDTFIPQTEQEVEDNFEDTIELDVIEASDFEDETEDGRDDKNVLEEFEDLFLDE